MIRSELKILFAIFGLLAIAESLSRGWTCLLPPAEGLRFWEFNSVFLLGLVEASAAFFLLVTLLPKRFNPLTATQAVAFFGAGVGIELMCIWHLRYYVTTYLYPKYYWDVRAVLDVAQAKAVLMSVVFLGASLTLLTVLWREKKL